MDNLTIKTPGGELASTLINNIELSLTSDLYTYFFKDIMATTAREKRRQRRSEETTRDQHRGLNMDTKTLRFCNYKQELAYNTIMSNTVTILHGSPGTGKTLIGLMAGMKMLANGDVDSIIYVRSDTPTDYQRGRGSLPGEMSDKMKPLMLPLLQNASLLLSPGSLDYAIAKGKITAVLIEDILGATFNRAFIIFDEAQQTLPINVKGVITRVGKNSKIVLAGDTKQINFHAFRQLNGLEDAIRRLEGVQDVGIVRFTPNEIIRNSVIPHILAAYDED